MDDVRSLIYRWGPSVFSVITTVPSNQVYSGFIDHPEEKYDTLFCVLCRVSSLNYIEQFNRAKLI